jgi:hypothetical protein
VAAQKARCQPGRSRSHARRYFTAGSIQCQAVAANTRSKAATPGGRQVSKAASITSTPIGHGVTRPGR